MASINLLTPPWNPILWIFEYHWQKYITTNYTEFLFYWDFPPQLLRFSTKGLFHQGAFLPRGFFTKGLFHQGAFLPRGFSTKGLFHQWDLPPILLTEVLKKCLILLQLFGQTSFLKTKLDFVTNKCEKIFSKREFSTKGIFHQWKQIICYHFLVKQVFSKKVRFCCQ